MRLLPGRKKEVIVRVYEHKNLKGARKAYEKDARRLKKDGYTVSQQCVSSEEKRARGCFLFWERPKANITVTYERSKRK